MKYLLYSKQFELFALFSIVRSQYGDPAGWQKQEGKMKVLPKKPKQNSSYPTPSDFTDEPNIIKEENIFDFVSDFNVVVNIASPSPSEANVITENNITLETYGSPKQESEDLDDCCGLTSFHAPASMIEGLRFDENETDRKSIESGKAAEID